MNLPLYLFNNPNEKMTPQPNRGTHDISRTISADNHSINRRMTQQPPNSIPAHITFNSSNEIMTSYFNSLFFNLPNRRMTSNHNTPDILENNSLMTELKTIEKDIISAEIDLFQYYRIRKSRIRCDYLIQKFILPWISMQNIQEEIKINGSEK